MLRSRLEGEETAHAAAEDKVSEVENRLAESEANVVGNSTFHFLEFSFSMILPIFLNVVIGDVFVLNISIL